MMVLKFFSWDHETVFKSLNSQNYSHVKSKNVVMSQMYSENILASLHFNFSSVFSDYMEIYLPRDR